MFCKSVARESDGEGNLGLKYIIGVVQCYSMSCLVRVCGARINKYAVLVFYVVSQLVVVCACV